MQFCRDILMGQKIEKNELKIHYYIQEWNTNTTTYHILHNHYNYSTVCLLLDTAHRTDHCITVCGKWIFDSNLEFALPLTTASLNYICSGNDTDDITFVGVLHEIRAVPPVGVPKRLNIKQELLIVINIRFITINIVVIFFFHIFIMVNISLASIFSNIT